MLNLFYFAFVKEIAGIVKVFPFDLGVFTG